MKLLLSSLTLVVLVAGIFITANLTQTRQALNSFAQSNEQTQTQTVGDPNSDIDGDGQVSIFDYNSVITNFGRKFDPASGVINVKAFGAKGDGVTDDTPAFQKAIEEAKKDPRIPRKIFIPNGFYHISSLNLTNLNIKIEGESMAGTQIISTKQANPQPILDLTGAQYNEIENISVFGGGKDFNGATAAVNPNIGILIASAPQRNSTKVLMKNVYVGGHFTVSSVYIYGNCCSNYTGVHFQSFEANIPSLIITGTNTRNVQSPYTAIATGKQDTIDHTFTAGEFHNLSNLYGSPTSINPNSSTIEIETTRGIRFLGGVMSACAPSILRVTGDAKSISLYDVLLAKNQEGNGCPIPDYGVFVNNRIDGLTLSNLENEGFNKALLGGSGTTGLFGLNITGYTKSAFFETNPYKLIDIPGGDPTSWKLVDSLIMANSMEISVGGSIVRSKIIGQGQVLTPQGATRDFSN